MHVDFRRFRSTAALLIAVSGAGLLSSPAQAADPGRLAHRILAAKILRDASDRFDVRFTSTHTDRLPGGQREVTGQGRFRRLRKTAQIFTYHTTVNIYDNSDRNTGYDIR